MSGVLFSEGLRFTARFFGIVICILRNFVTKNGRHWIEKLRSRKLYSIACTVSSSSWGTTSIMLFETDFIVGKAASLQSSPVEIKPYKSPLELSPENRSIMAKFAKKLSSIEPGPGSQVWIQYFDIFKLAIIQNYVLCKKSAMERSASIKKRFLHHPELHVDVSVLPVWLDSRKLAKENLWVHLVAVVAIARVCMGKLDYRVGRLCFLTPCTKSSSWKRAGQSKLVFFHNFYYAFLIKKLRVS